MATNGDAVAGDGTTAHNGAATPDDGTTTPDDAATGNHAMTARGSATGDTAARGQAKPASPAGPPDPTTRRLTQSLRDMVWSLVALLLIIGALLVFNRGCSFSPGGPSIEPSSAPSVDLAQVLPGSAKTVDFPLRLPEVPDGWVANSASTGAVPPAAVVVRSGWLTPGRFVQLSQSGAAEGDLVRVETGQDDPAATGTVDISGTKWTVFPGRRDEAAWLADLGDVRLLITGTGTEAEFRALAQAAQQAAPLE